MAISGNLKLISAFNSYRNQPFRHLSIPNSKPKLTSFPCRGSNGLKISHNSSTEPNGQSTKRNYQCSAIPDNRFSSTALNQDIESFLLNTINMSFLDRLGLAWRLLFPKKSTRLDSNSRIAKQRLKMILYSDRCAVSDEAKQKIVTNIIQALSDFVEIDSHDKVQLNVSTDPDLGTVYSVTVPVRRVKPEYQESEVDCIGKITGVEYKDTGETSGTVDVTFDFYLPNDKWSSRL